MSLELLIALFAGAASFLFLAYVVRARTLRPAESRLRHLGAPSNDVVMAQEGDEVALLRRGPSNAVVSRAISTSRYADNWQRSLDRADMKLRPSEYFLIRLILAALAVAVVMLLGRSAIAFLISIPLALIAFMLPAYWVNIRIRRRMQKIDAQLEETLTLIANSLRAGFAFPQGVDTAAKRMGEPMSVELGRILLDVNLGKTMEDALIAMNERIGSDDVDMFVTAVLVQRQAGGNLAEVLESVALTIRERERIKGEIRTLTSAQRFTGWVLSLWPAALAFMFFLIAPDMMSLLWTTGAGIVLLIIWGALNLMGVIVIQKILSIDI